MYFKIQKDILFREYAEYGYMTDNTLFGYRMLNDNTQLPGEKYVSKSGAIMLGALSKKPQHIDEVLKKISDVFVGVEYDELKADTVEFFMRFVDEGFLSFGCTVDECECTNQIFVDQDNNSKNTAIATENCSKNIFSQNDFLRSIHIEIASECNERCLHCYIPHEHKTKFIDSDLFYKILEDGRELNIINVTLSGGEPLMHKDFLLFLKKCRELDLSVNVLTNLTLLSDEIVAEMKKNPLLSVQTSVYSMNSDIHDSITKVKGSFDKTKANLLKLCSEGIPLQISCPVMKQNKDSFADVIKWGNENNIQVAVEYVIFASYDHSNKNLVNRLSLSEVGEAFDKQISDSYIEMLCDTAREKEALTEESSICSICRYNFCVSAEGDVFPCVGWQSKKIGDLNLQSVKDIWESSEEIKRLRQITRKDFPKCVECKDRGYCTVCMMSNSNENGTGKEFVINDFHCNVAKMLHDKVEAQLKSKRRV